MIDGEIKRLTRMLVTLGQMNVVVLDPPPPEAWKNAVKPAGTGVPVAVEAVDDDAGDGAGAPEPGSQSSQPVATARVKPPTVSELMGRLKLGEHVGSTAGAKAKSDAARAAATSVTPPYDPVTATPTEKLQQLMVFRAVHPLYGLFLLDHLGKADDHELVQILESLLEIPGSVASSVRVPWPDELPPGRLSVEVVAPAILTRGLATQEDLYPQADQSDGEPALRKYPVPLAQKMRMLFESEVDHAGGLFVTPVWAVGDLLAHGGDFDKFVRARDLIKQEGVFFKHLLRMILLCREFEQLVPRDADPVAWRARLTNISEVLVRACRTVDPQSTDEMLEELAGSP